MMPRTGSRGGGIVRHLIFVGVIMGVVAAYCYAMWRALPPLRDEPAALLLLPMTVISGVVAALLYPVLRRSHGRSSQTSALYVGFVVTTAIYGLYLWAIIPGGTAWLILLALLAGHMYGFPLFLAVLGAQLLLAHRLFPRDGQ